MMSLTITVMNGMVIDDLGILSSHFVQARVGYRHNAKDSERGLDISEMNRPEFDQLENGMLFGGHC